MRAALEILENDVEGLASIRVQGVSKQLTIWGIVRRKFRAFEAFCLHGETHAKNR